MATAIGTLTKWRDWPWQWVPFPVNPCVQEQMNDPLVFVQWASAWQLWSPPAHSSVSRATTSVIWSLLFYKQTKRTIILVANSFERNFPDKGLEAPRREGPEKSRFETVAPNRLADRKHCALSIQPNLRHLIPFPSIHATPLAFRFLQLSDVHRTQCVLQFFARFLQE